MQSEEKLLKEIKQDPDSIQKYWDLAQYYLQNDNTKKLRLFLDAIIRRFYFVVEFIHLRAQLFIADQAWSKAELDMKRCIELKPNNALFHDTLGVILQQRELYDKAIAAHKKAIELDPNHKGFLFNYAVANDKAGKANIAKHYYEGLVNRFKNYTAPKLNLAIILKKEGDYERAKEILLGIVKQSPDYFSALMELGSIAKQENNLDEACEWYEKAKTVKPGNLELDFILDSLNGVTEEKPPASYVKSLFDDFADSFDDKLLNQLQYHIPQEMYVLLKPYLRPEMKWLDLGAGTGLLAYYLKPYCAQSVAVDLSRKMLEKAEKQNLYNAYICNDIEQAMLGMENGHYDLISAADVFVYMGSLKPVFRQIARLLKSNGLFTFSTEYNTDNDKDYSVKDTMRYGHSTLYLERLASEEGLTFVRREKKVIRMNKGDALEGDLFLFVKKE